MDWDGEDGDQLSTVWSLPTNGEPFAFADWNDTYYVYLDVGDWGVAPWISADLGSIPGALAEDPHAVSGVDG